LERTSKDLEKAKVLRRSSKGVHNRKEIKSKSAATPSRVCDTPVSPRVSLEKPNQKPSFYVNQSKHEHQNNLSEKEFTKYA
jgi:hypothetical protein